MFLGKARVRYGYNGTPYYFTRKDRRVIKDWDGWHCNPGKKNKKCYNRQLRNGKLKLHDFKNNEWKKAKCADTWNWC